MRIASLLAVLALTVAGNALAQCPAGIPNTPGCIPPDGPGWRHNMPAPSGGYSEPTHRRSAPPPPIYTPLQPTRLYGAHAMAHARGQLYSATGDTSRESARSKAVAFCEQETGQRCTLLHDFGESCQVYAFDPRLNAYRGMDRDPLLATRQAMAACLRGAGRGRCELWRLPRCGGAADAGPPDGGGTTWADAEYEAEVRDLARQTERALLR